MGILDSKNLQPTPEQTKGMKINAVYTKRTDKSGCHFGLETDYDADRLCRMLSLHGIECVKIIRTGDKR